ncbi:hypothetical protein LX32DRAFT_1874 [Colletotrichum zoysiae]|uniref:Uncharacterized protein n=1 Tax=Colletotrichum zoysiae TaxID=1216348 RepID=A0AAD9M9P5_9PEZI|nr:hypothetical protein LX32DRAFT_1874 [Colletotrichum zoysiae]
MLAARDIVSLIGQDLGVETGITASVAYERELHVDKIEDVCRHHKTRITNDGSRVLAWRTCVPGMLRSKQEGRLGMNAHKLCSLLLPARNSIVAAHIMVQPSDYMTHESHPGHYINLHRTALSLSPTRPIRRRYPRPLTTPPPTIRRRPRVLIITPERGLEANLGMFSNGFFDPMRAGSGSCGRPPHEDWMEFDNGRRFRGVAVAQDRNTRTFVADTEAVVTVCA